MKRKITFIVNGEKVAVDVHPAKSLLRVLREDLGLTGTKAGCEAGECGACTVLLDGKPVASCLVLASQVEGRSVITIEGLSKNGQLHPLQRAFIEEGAVQCGYCIPGFIMASLPLLEGGDVREGISGNICRCGSYFRIEEAIRRARGMEG